MAKSDAQARALAKYLDRQRAAGAKRLTALLDPDTAALFDRLRQDGESSPALIRRALLALAATT